MSEQGELSVGGQAIIYGPAMGQNSGPVTATYAITVKEGGTVVQPSPPPTVERVSPPPPPATLRVWHDRKDELAALRTELTPRGGAWLYGAAGCGSSALLRAAASLPEAANLADGVVMVSAADLAASDSDYTVTHMDDLAQVLFDRCYRLSDPTKRMRVGTQEARPYLERLQILWVLDQPPLRHADLVRTRDMLVEGALLVASDSAGPNTMRDTELAGLPLEDARVFIAEIAGYSLDDLETSALLDKIGVALACLPSPLWLAGRLLRDGAISPAKMVEMLTSAREPKPMARIARMSLDTLGVGKVAALRALIGVGPASADLATLAGISRRTPADLEQDLAHLVSLRLVQLQEGRYELASRSLRRALRPILDTAAEQRNAAALYAALAPLQATDTAWVEREMGNLVAASRTAIDGGMMAELGSLARAIQPAAVLSGRWGLWVDTITWAESAARSLGDTALLAWVLHERGTLAGILGNIAVAIAQLSEAARLRHALGDYPGADMSLQNARLLDLPILPTLDPTAAQVATQSASVGSGLSLTTLATMVITAAAVLLLGSTAIRAVAPLPTAMPTSAPLAVVATPLPVSLPTMTNTREPTPSPSAIPEPTALPTATIEPTVPSTVTPEPTVPPTVTPEPTAPPTPTLAPTPEPTLTPTPAPVAAFDVCLTPEEAALAELINSYRIANGLERVPISKSLTHVAHLHVRDLHEQQPDTGTDSRGMECNMHSWSAQGLWSRVCYTDDHEYAEGMWIKPREITGGIYSASGYENAFGGHGYRATAAEAFSNWTTDVGHGDVIRERGIWRDKRWPAMGVGIYEGFAVLWFGDKIDPLGEVAPCP